MKIEQALKLKVGQRVRYPADRGSPAGSAVITHMPENPEIHSTITGVQFIWVCCGKAGVWPSNRLGGAV